MSHTTKSLFARLGLLLVLGSAGLGSLGGCCLHLPLPRPRHLQGQVVKQYKITGPEADGEKGSIKVIFSGSIKPKSRWWVDTGTTPPKSGLVHPVCSSPGETVSGFTSGNHIMYFTARKPAVEPIATVVPVTTWDTTVVEVEYQWR